MSSDSPVPGARRRELIRTAIGKPGSLRRWGIGTAIWALGCFVLATYADFVLRIAIFILGVAIPLSALRARTMLVGDEDELRAQVRQKRFSPPPPADIENDESDWFTDHGRGFEDAPPPPIAEEPEAEPAIADDRDTRGTRGA